jgi:hypothetical protein
MKIKKIAYNFLIAAGLLITAGSCELTDLNINNDPNSPTQATPKLLLPSAQLGLINWMSGINNDAHGFVGILSSNDNYNLANTSYNGFWASFFVGGGKDLDELIKGATQAGNQPHYLGIAQTMKAYFYGTMVDMFGDVPYSEAFKANEVIPNTNPKFDKDKDIYDALIKLCDDAIVNLNKIQGQPVKGDNDRSDVIFNGDINSWKLVANSVKFRLLVNSRRVRTTAKTEIDAVLRAGVITNSANDLKFTYNNLRTPDGRHPWAQAGYSGDNLFTYFSHQIMAEMIENDDPRLPFYFRRQTRRILDQNDPTDRNSTPCTGVSTCGYGYMVLNPKIVNRLLVDKGKVPISVGNNLKAITDIFVSFGNNAASIQNSLVNNFRYTPEQAKAIYDELTFLAGYFGRDKGDFSGVPQDVNFRTAPGVYPAGGLYDGREIEVKPTNGTSGKGQGVFPMITNFQIGFLKTEAILTLGVAGNARDEFKRAIEEQFKFVQSVGEANDSNTKKMDVAAITKYVNSFLDRYDKATTNEQKLNVVLKQAWFSNFGNGIEIYNAFRRTGYPNDIQLNVMRPPRQFALRLPYPQQELTYNPNAASYKDVIFDRDAIFWDVLKYKLPL